MLYIKDIMTTEVITAPSTMPVHEAQKLMRERKLRRLPIVDDGKLVGIVSRDRLERVEPPPGTPMLWEMRHLIARTTLKDIMRKDLVTIHPDAPVEQGAALAQRVKVGALLVVEDDKLVGICTTNDFFYRVLNPIFGIGEPGVRLSIAEAGEDKALEEVLACIRQQGIRIKTMFTMHVPEKKLTELLVHLDTEDASSLITCLRDMGYVVEVRPR